MTTKYSHPPAAQPRPSYSVQKKHTHGCSKGSMVNLDLDIPHLPLIFIMGTERLRSYANDLSPVLTHPHMSTLHHMSSPTLSALLHYAICHDLPKPLSIVSHAVWPHGHVSCPAQHCTKPMHLYQAFRTPASMHSQVNASASHACPLVCATTHAIFIPRH